MSSWFVGEFRKIASTVFLLVVVLLVVGDSVWEVPEVCDTTGLAVAEFLPPLNSFQTLLQLFS
jgi:hypothetical protein